jgi:hypothetical protein
MPVRFLSESHNPVIKSVAALLLEHFTTKEFITEVQRLLARLTSAVFH